MNITLETIKVDKNGQESDCCSLCVEEFNSIDTIATDFEIHKDDEKCTFTISFKGSEKGRALKVECESIDVFNTPQFPSFNPTTIGYDPSDNEGLRLVRDELKSILRSKEILITKYNVIGNGDIYKLMIAGLNGDKITFRSKKPE